MTKVPLQKTLTVFWLLVSTDLLAILFESAWLHTIVKPLLMPVLIAGVVNSVAEAAGKKTILAGLFFSWLGDVFLLFETSSHLFFIAGLISFLITHACYIIYFLSIRSHAPSFLRRHPLFILLIVSYGAALVGLLFPYLGVLKFPVIIYGAAICTMLLSSLHIFLKIKAPANIYFVLGAALFVLSDSLLAINKFYQPLPVAGIWIMLSYCAAQYLVVVGYVSMKNR